MRPPFESTCALATVIEVVPGDRTAGRDSSALSRNVEIAEVLVHVVCRDRRARDGGGPQVAESDRCSSHYSASMPACDAMRSHLGNDDHVLKFEPYVLLGSER